MTTKEQAATEGRGVPCPDCGANAPEYDWDEVDVGVGIIRGNIEYMCPEHGGFAFCSDGQPSFRDRPETWGLNRATATPGGKEP